MRLLTVELENFRCHERTLVEFERGINLILGQNGSGKSSIIEAIGLCLFGGGLRDRQSDAISRNQSRARVCVTFLAEDGNQYRVEKVIGTTSSHELWQGELLLARGKDPVIEKTRSICMLQGDSAKTFENVIVAFQNKIAEQFLESAMPRREYFNRVFQVDLYRLIATDFMRSYIAGLRNDLEFIERDTAFLRTQLEKREEIDGRFNSLVSEIARSQENLKILELALSDKKSELVNLENLARKVSLAHENLKSGITLLREEAVSLAQRLRQKKQAHEAGEAVKLATSGHRKYGELSSEREVLDRERKELETRLRRRREVERTLWKKEAEAASLRETVFNVRESIRENELELTTLKGQLAKKRDEYESKVRLTREADLAVDVKIAKREAFRVLLEEYDKNLRELATTERLLKEKDDELALLAGLDLECARVEAEHEKLKPLLAERDRLESEKVGVLTQKESLIRSVDSLGRGVCPLLKENCKNIADRENFDDYMCRTLEEIDVYEKKLDDRLDKLKAVPNMSEELRARNIRLNERKERRNRLLEEKAAQAGKQKTLKYLCDKAIEQLRAVSGRSGSLEEMAEALEREVDRVREKTALDKAEVARLNKELAEASNLLTTKSERNKVLENQKRELDSRDTLLNKELGELNGELAESEALLTRVPKVAGELEEIDKQLALYKSDFESYNLNVSLASYLEEYSRLSLSSLEKCKERSGAVLEQREKLQRLKVAFDPTVLESVREEVKEFEKGYMSARDWATSLKSELLSLNGEREQLKKYTEELVEKVELKEKTLSKIALAEKLRDNLNLTGEKITAGFREAIQKKATYDYRKISGMIESIVWNDDYEVFLKSVDEKGSNLRSFSNLSGGEQVLVSLCLRAAMTGVLSGAKFAIFDEPTANLDREKKELLTQSMRELFGELEQTIIVTHDDIFTEMAQKVIRLDREGGYDVEVIY